MTLDTILLGLEELVLRLGNNADLTTPPAEWTAAEWAYVKGLASAQILQLAERMRQRP